MLLLAIPEGLQTIRAARQFWLRGRLTTTPTRFSHSK